jgi:AcrR family transcriptional regulator
VKIAAIPARDRILNAVMQLIRDGGVHAVTLSAVCRLASISKGGLVHHFPSKESLIDAFLDRAAEEYTSFFDTRLARVSKGNGRWTLAWLNLFLLESERAVRGSTDRPAEEQCTAVLLALIQSSGRDGMAKSLFDHVFHQMRADGISLDLATTLLVTMDGYWFQSVIEHPAELRLRAARLRRQLRKAVQADVKAAPRKVSRRKVRS